MSFEQIDKNTYIQRPTVEVKGRTPSLKNIREVTTTQVLTNNLENSLITRFSSSSFINQPDGYTTLINYLKSSGELLAIIDALPTDILSDGHKFIGSESNVKIAEEFYNKNNFDMSLHKWLNDTFLYGNGFLVKNFITETQIKSVINKYTNGFETKEFDKLSLEIKEYADELASKNVVVQHLPAITVSIFALDKYGNEIIYKQKVGTEEEKFTANEVIHLKDIDIDGKLWGYSRLYSIKSELQTLAFIKDYYGLYFENNATPDKLFIAKNMKFGTPEHKDALLQLQEMKKPENKRKNLLVLSDWDIKDLNTNANDKQFENLWKSLISLIAMTYEMPASRYGGTMNATAEEATLSNQGYYRNISSWQDKIENVLNRQLFLPVFNVEIKFNRNYKEDEIRETIILKTKTDIAEQRMRMKLWTRESAANFLEIKTEEMPTDEEIESDKEELANQYMQGQVKDIVKQDEHIQHEKKNHTPKSKKKDTN